MQKNLMIRAAVLLSALLLVGCPETKENEEPTYKVTYAENGSTGGTPPTDPTAYKAGASVTVLGNTGGLTRTGFTFGGWETDGGILYPAGKIFKIHDNTTLTAKWGIYTVTYNGGEGSSGTAPTDPTAYNAGDRVTVLEKPADLAKSGYTFEGWKLTAEGPPAIEGGIYNAGKTFAIHGNTTLTAQWEPVPPISQPISVKEDEDTLKIRAIGESVTADDLKAYVSADGKAVIIATASQTGFVELDQNRVNKAPTPNGTPDNESGTIITVTIPKGAASSATNGTAADAQLKVGMVTVRLVTEKDIDLIIVEPSISPARQLGLDLTAKSISAGVENATGTVTLSSANPSIATNTSLTVYAGATLIVPSSLSLTIVGELIVAGKLQVKEGGIVQVSKDAKVTIKENGELDILQGGISPSYIKFCDDENNILTQFDGVGTWEASGDDITITSSTTTGTGESISGTKGAKFTTKDGGSGTLTASGTPIITQKYRQYNALVIGAGVTINLGGTTTSKVGEIILERNEATNAETTEFHHGKIQFEGQSAQIKTGLSDGIEGIGGKFLVKDGTHLLKDFKMQVSSSNGLAIKGTSSTLTYIQYKEGVSPSITGPKFENGSISSVTACRD
ncbi:MAG: InlB B-repeat-containing protein [Spirochaetaceae bacterium]|jgi:uncharacterized repeat protein (TIGR02543 family)|nr:InlB B-repeat-containing protein [Spirochaetaceae bacterium]